MNPGVGWHLRRRVRGPHSLKLEGARFVGRSLRGARFIDSDLSHVRARGVLLDGADFDSPWLLDGEGSLVVNGVDVAPLVEVELNRRFPGRELQKSQTPEGLRVAATCTIANLVARAATAPAHWPAAQLVPAAANALLASFKIWNTATVGGNICRAFAAGAMVSLSVALDAVAVIWTKDDERRMPVADLVTGNGTTNLGRGDVLRAVEIPTHALASRALLRKIALAEHGRSGAVVTGRVDPDGTSVFTVTAATATPTVLRFAQLPTETDLADAVASAPGYYTDPLGAADWRRAVSIELASRIRAELA